MCWTSPTTSSALFAASGHCRPRRASSTTSAGASHLRVEGYASASRTSSSGARTRAARLARVARYDFPAALAASVPTDPIITTIPDNDGRGGAYGFDLFVSRMSVPSGARLSGWASYTWSKADRQAYGQRYAFEYDRRHAVAMVASYRLTPRWELASTTRIASGFPAPRRSASGWPPSKTRVTLTATASPGSSCQTATRQAPGLRGGFRLRGQSQPGTAAGVRARGRTRHVAASRSLRALGDLRGGHQPAEPQERRRVRSAARARSQLGPAPHRREARSVDSSAAHAGAPFQVLAAQTLRIIRGLRHCRRVGRDP